MPFDSMPSHKFFISPQIPPQFRPIHSVLLSIHSVLWQAKLTIPTGQKGAMAKGINGIFKLEKVKVKRQKDAFENNLFVCIKSNDSTKQFKIISRFHIFPLSALRFLYLRPPPLVLRLLSDCQCPSLMLLPFRRGRRRFHNFFALEQLLNVIFGQGFVLQQSLGQQMMLLLKLPFLKCTLFVSVVQTPFHIVPLPTFRFVNSSLTRSWLCCNRFSISRSIVSLVLGPLSTQKPCSDSIGSTLKRTLRWGCF